MDLGLTNQVAIVTGSSRGIGRAIALASPPRGAASCSRARGRADLDAPSPRPGRGGPRAEAARGLADVTTAEGVALVVDARRRVRRRRHPGEQRRRLGRARFPDADDADWPRVLDRNLWPAFRCSRAALPQLRARGGGAIVMITSIWGREAGGGPSYNVAKAAEIALAKAMARDLASDKSA